MTGIYSGCDHTSFPQGGSNAEEMVSKGSLDTNEMVKCKMTFKGAIYRGIYSYKAFIKRSCKLAATIKKRNLKSCGNTSRGAQK